MMLKDTFLRLYMDRSLKTYTCPSPGTVGFVRNRYLCVACTRGKVTVQVVRTRVTPSGLPPPVRGGSVQIRYSHGTSPSRRGGCICPAEQHTFAAGVRYCRAGPEGRQPSGANRASNGRWRAGRLMAVFTSRSARLPWVYKELAQIRPQFFSPPF
ncbi:hypothetical protein Bbelb_328450 [Branchiostoma belcheri]|nr:hypothetical protein Bbelb_328450 [Branchiostoma belcheri]